MTVSRITIQLIHSFALDDTSPGGSPSSPSKKAIFRQRTSRASRSRSDAFQIFEEYHLKTDNESKLK